MTHWAEADWDSIVQVTAGRPSGSKETVGTGFVVQVADDATWVVTCAHVIEDGAPDGVRVDGRPAQSVGKERPDIDLAVLKVEGRLDARPWGLTTLYGTAADVPGWHAVAQGAKDQQCERLRTVVGRRKRFSRQPGTTQHTLALKVAGFADADSARFDPEEPLIDHGYSGAPVICLTQHAVFAVARYKHGDGGAGYAIAIEHLREIWPDDAPGLVWQDLADQPLDGDTSQSLAELFSPLPAGLTLDALKVHCERCAPPGLELDFPPGGDPFAFLFWLIRKGRLVNRHLLLYDVLARLEPAITDDLRRQRLRDIREAIAACNPDLDCTQPAADDPAAEPCCMEIELLDVVPEQTGKRFYVQARFAPPGGQAPRSVDLGRWLDRDGLDPRNAVATGELLDLLLGRLGRYAGAGQRVTFAFRLPWSQLALPVDRWRPSDGDPIGADFPVVVQYAPRHAAADCNWLWQTHWSTLEARLHEPFPAPLHWCDAPAADIAQAKDAARGALEAGACIALGQPPTADGDGNTNLLRYLLGGRFAPVVLWPRRALDAQRLRRCVDTALAGRPLRDLAELMRGLRRALPDQPGPDDAAAHLTLLWDPPPVGDWEGLYGVGE